MPEPSLAKQAEYEKLTKKLKQALQKKKDLDSQMSKLEEEIYNKESIYLSEGASQGNLLKGFENFAKISTSTVSSHNSKNRKIQFGDEDRVFSLSSAKYVRKLKKLNRENGDGGDDDDDDDDDDDEDSDDDDDDDTGDNKASESSQKTNSKAPRSSSATPRKNKNGD
ncbi:unnamed protein product [[Candida] boidinii]|uniref:Chromatin modification-related protein EAF6 n=1 Tax=Candida boidinii TaxID=5477 RepID=A0A9W6W839_CANBO|nr:hypothetical protein B5S30_g1771 [[Candida] boidinii]OWB82938.1 hypothetical protein B5S33_g1567 [[Candida] boidinii]GME67784.1 unnamed protein product [[Candida] boidinii]GMF15522.1 unnamed protein product [[Candida] boidinii]GMF63712.1 unnamed protein product [[Candida] boidinii]